MLLIIHTSNWNWKCHTWQIWSIIDYFQVSSNKHQETLEGLISSAAKKRVDWKEEIHQGRSQWLICCYKLKKQPPRGTQTQHLGTRVGPVLGLVPWAGDQALTPVLPAGGLQYPAHFGLSAAGLRTTGDASHSVMMFLCDSNLSPFTFSQLVRDERAVRSFRSGHHHGGEGCDEAVLQGHVQGQGCPPGSLLLSTEVTSFHTKEQNVRSHFTSSSRKRGDALQMLTCSPAAAEWWDTPTDAPRSFQRCRTLLGMWLLSLQHGPELPAGSPGEAGEDGQSSDSTVNPAATSQLSLLLSSPLSALLMDRWARRVE